MSTTKEQGMATYNPSTFHTPSECQGQMILVSYALDDELEVIVARSENWNTQTTSYTAYSYPVAGVEEWSPWNSVPELGPEIGPCAITERL